MRAEIHIWKVLVLDLLLCTDIFMSKIFVSQFFPPKMSLICFIFHLMNTQFFMSLALFHPVAEKIYIYSQG